MRNENETAVQRESVLNELRAMGTPETILTLISTWDDAVLAQFVFFLAFLAQSHRNACAETCMTFARSKQNQA